MVTIALSVITDRLICIEYLCIFNLNHSSVPSVKEVGCQTFTTLANHSSGSLLPRLQSATTIQMERSNGGGSKQDRNYPFSSKL